MIVNTLIPSWETMDTKLKKRSRAGRPTAEQARRRHQELLERALDLFLENGFELTTLDAIAADMRMTKRTIYGLYEGKERLFKAAVKQAITETVVTLESYEALETDDLKATLEAVAKLRIDMFVSPKGMRLQRVITAESFRFPELLLEAYEEGTGPTIEFLKNVFKKHTTAGTLQVDRPETAASIFLSMAVGTPARAILSGGALKYNLSLDDHVSYCVDLFLNGIVRHEP